MCITPCICPSGPTPSLELCIFFSLSSKDVLDMSRHPNRSFAGRILGNL